MNASSLSRRAAWPACLLALCACASPPPPAPTPAAPVLQGGAQSLWQLNACLAALPDSALRPETLFVRTFAYRLASPAFLLGAADLTQRVASQLSYLLGAQGDSIPVAEPRFSWRTLGFGGLVVVLSHSQGIHLRRIAGPPRPDTLQVPLMEQALRVALATDPMLSNLIEATDDSLVVALGPRWGGTFHGGRALDPPIPSLLIRVPAEERPERVAGPPPVYPQAARNSGVNGHVLVEFVVDSTGQIEASSIHELPVYSPADGGQYHRDFVEAGIEAIRRSTFRPGTIGRCPVRVRVQQPINFVVMGNRGEGSIPRPMGAPPKDHVPTPSNRPFGP